MEHKLDEATAIRDCDDSNNKSDDTEDYPGVHKSHILTILSNCPADRSTAQQQWHNYACFVLTCTRKRMPEDDSIVCTAKYLHLAAAYLRKNFGQDSQAAVDGVAVLSTWASILVPLNDPDRAALLNLTIQIRIQRFKAEEDIRDFLSVLVYSESLLESIPTSDSQKHHNFWCTMAIVALEAFENIQILSHHEKTMRHFVQVFWLKAAELKVNRSLPVLSATSGTNKVEWCVDILEVALWCAQMAWVLIPKGVYNPSARKTQHQIAVALVKQRGSEKDHELLVDVVDAKYLGSKNEEDLDAILEVCNDALHAHPGYWAFGRIRLRLAAYYERKFLLSKDETHLQGALEILRGTLSWDHTIERDVEFPASWLHLFSACLSYRFACSGDPAELDRAIDAASKAIGVDSKRSLSPKKDRQTFVLTLGIILFQRYTHISHAAEDLESSAALLMQSKDDFLGNHPDQDYFVLSLSGILLQCYKRFGLLKYLEDIIDVVSAVLRGQPRGRYFLLAELCRSLHQMFEHTRQPSYHKRCFQELSSLEAALRERRSLEHPDHEPGLVYALVSDIYRREFYMRKGEKAAASALENWRRYAAEAVQIGHVELENRESLHTQLGDALLERFHGTKNVDDLQSAIHHLKIALETISFEPLRRIQCGLKLAIALSMLPDWQQAYEVLEKAVSWLTLISFQTRIEDDQQYMLGRLASLSSMSYSCAINAGKSAAEGMTLMESARGVMSSLMIKSKGDVSALRTLEPELYEQYQQLQKATANPSFLSPTWNNSFANPVLKTQQDVEQVVESLKDVVGQIRKVEGFERFQLPPSPEELERLAEDGPLVSFSVSIMRSDAVLVTSSKIINLSLPELSLTKLRQHKELLPKGNESRRNATIVHEGHETDKPASPTGDQSFRASLIWLWKVAVKPVLVALGLMSEKGSQKRALPRILWVGGGLMSLMPLHAAGDHSPGSTDNTISHVISSYAASFTAHSSIKKRAWDLKRPKGLKILTVAMPKTAGHPDLNVAAEMKSIERRVAAVSGISIEQAKGKTEAIENLADSDIAHFACHGCSDPYNPLDGGLLLGDSPEDRLTLRDLRPLSNHLGQIAYLSACSTAELRDQNLAEESIHMTLMFQLIGFRHVVGTMWGANDEAAVFVAKTFYRKLFGSDVYVNEGGDGDGLVALALHDATVELRKVKPEPEYWAPFVHFGP